MATRKPNYRLVKIHRSYAVDEISKVLNVHRNTVRQWTKQGLSTIDARKPMLIHGRELIEFLKARRLKNKRPCRANEIYCVRCRTPVEPAEGMTEYKPTTATLGNLIGICPRCGSLICRRVNIAKLSGQHAHGDFPAAERQSRITESDIPSVNSALTPMSRDHGNTQSR